VREQHHLVARSPSLLRRSLLSHLGFYSADRRHLVHVEEKIGEQSFRVLSEMRILAKNKVVILDLVG